MATDPTKVRVGVTGIVSRGATSATAPTSTGSTLTGYTDLGLVTEDGVTLTLPGSGDTTPIKAWQNAQVVRVIRTPTEDSPTFQLVLMETKLEVIETWANATTTNQTATDGAVAFNSNTLRGYFSYVIDVIDGADLIRNYVPRGIVSDVGDLVYANGEPIGYDVTITAEFDSVKGFNFKQFSTALKTP